MANIRISNKTKINLDKVKVHPRQSYDELIKKRFGFND